MKNARLLAILLVAATVLVDLVALSALAGSHEFRPVWPHPAVVVIYALAMSQVSLAAIWMGWSRTWLSWRTLSLVLTIVVWSRLVAWYGGELRFTLVTALIAVWFHNPNFPSEPESLDVFASLYGLVLFTQCMGIVLLSLLARWAGFKLIRVGRMAGHEPSVAGRPRWQFSVGYLLSWITVVAVSLGALRHAFDYRGLWGVGAWFWRNSAVSALVHAALALVALWTALGARRPWLRGVALALTTVAAIAAVHTLAETRGLRAYAALCVLQVAWLLASLWVVRVAGYRIVREPREALDRRSPLSDGR